MAKRKKQTKKASPFNPAFAELAQLKEQAKSAPTQKAPVVHKAQVQTRHIPEPPQAQAARVSKPGYGGEKIVVRRESAARGRMLTRVSGIVGPQDELEFLAVLMKRRLGCNAFVENRAIVLQGRHDRHAAEWLRSWGAEQVVIER